MQNSYENGLLEELADIDARIVRLKDEREAVVRLLTKARARHTVSQTVGRKNSMGRLLVEVVVLETLRASDTAMRSAELLVRVQYAVPGLKETTFRSHLHRMKAQGSIKNFQGQRGRWVACAAVEESEKAIPLRLDA